MSSPSLKRRNSDEERISPPPSKRALKQTSITTKEAVHNFFTPTSQKPKDEKLSWRIVDSSLIVGRYNPTISTDSVKSKGITRSEREKIAAFDFDSTLITPISKAKFARDANDWCWWHGSVPGKLKALHDEGYRLVIVSNQSGISIKNANGPKLKSDRFTQFKQKAGAAFNTLNLPISLYAATEKDRFRKPMTGMWTEFLKDQGVEPKDVDLLHSIYVGDAGGRTAGTVNGKAVKADFACSDRNFAENVGLNFKSPEEFFLGQPSRAFSRSFDPSSYLRSDTEAGELYRSKFTRRTSPELVVFVGSPGAGKSTFYRTYFEPLGYVRANQDTLKSRERCVKLAEESLRSDKSVVIDNTNPDQDVRRVWTSLAKKHNMPIRCVYFATDRELAKHNDVFRALSGLQETNPESREVLPQMAFNHYASRFKEPQLDEGFYEIIQVEFNFFGSEQAKEAWSRYWF